MPHHAPQGYLCPFCTVARGEDDERVMTKQAEVIYADARITAFISAGGWIPNGCHVLIIPNGHYESIYELPDEAAAKIAAFARIAALALKGAYGCDGVTIRQNNEPAGGQDVWHYHLHVVPRYDGDDMSNSLRGIFPLEQRIRCAELLRAHLAGAFSAKEETAR